MKIKLIVIGKTNRKELQLWINEYLQRLNHYLPFEFVVVPDLKNTKGMRLETQKKLEGERLLTHIKKEEVLILMDEKGKKVDSVSFSKDIQKKMLSGTKTIVYVIGGAYGFSPAVYERAQQKISLSPMTFSHQMVRIFAIEQLYRAMTILKNEPYHHA